YFPGIANYYATASGELNSFPYNSSTAMFYYNVDAFEKAGITFKPDTNDMREAASLEIIPLLQEAGATVHVYDPAGMEEGRHLLPGV
ncbi:extracellular solute-binding protein, partial [Burkholderia sp. SIMBA_013]